MIKWLAVMVRIQQASAQISVHRRAIVTVNFLCCLRFFKIIVGIVTYICEIMWHLRFVTAVVMKSSHLSFHLDILLDLFFCPEDGGDMFLRNIG
jgi:hypothetical protein